MATSIIKTDTPALTITQQANTSINARCKGRLVVGQATFDAVPQGWSTRGTISPTPSTDLNFWIVSSSLEFGVLRITSTGDVKVWHGGSEMRAFYGVPFTYQF